MPHLSKKQKSNLRQLLEELKKDLRLNNKIILAFREMNDWGSCSFNGKSFIITISIESDVNSAISTLIHELAHALAGAKKDDISHSDYWGKCYSKVYRSWLKLEFGSDD